MSNVRIYDAAAKVLAREIAACLDRATPLSLGEAGIDALTETISRHFPNRIAGTLPEWSTCKTASDNRTASPLQKFIYEYEPREGDSAWRDDLSAALAAFDPTTCKELLEEVEWLRGLISNMQFPLGD
jgi:hypothetical protein